MPISYIFSSMCIFNGLFALVAGGATLIWKKGKDRIHWLLIAFSIASAIWSLGFGVFYIQTNFDVAHIYKCIAISGTVSYMIWAQALMGRISMIDRKVVVFFDSVALLGIPVYALSVLPGQTIYVMSNMGITYSFKPGIISIIYTAYFTIVSANMLFIIIYMLKNKSLQRMRFFGRLFMVVLVLNLIGTVFDMVFPAIGLSAIPGSNVTQFWALIVVHYAVRAVDKNRIGATNMTEYIYSSLADPFMVTDNEGNVQLMNDAAIAFFHMEGSQNEIYSKHFDDLFKFDHRRLNPSLDHIELEARDTRENRPCTVSSSRIHDNFGDPLGYVIYIKDVSERVRYITELNRAREEAELSSKAKTTFLANMSHEIRTPMNAIIGFSEIILKQNLELDQIQEYAENIRDSSYGLLGLINDILDITKIESGKVSMNNVGYNLKTLIENVLAQIKPLADKKGLQLRYEIDEKAPVGVFGDEAKIREVLINLLNNAVKYTEKGSVTLKMASKLIENDERVELVFDVVDTGYGIKEEEQEAIFEAFEQVNKTLHAGIEGTGLGLAIVKGYTELMGGRIGVRSELGKGSDFYFELSQNVTDKAAIGAIGTKKQGKSHIGELKFEGVRVLVVDDNLINLKVSSKTLECYGLSVDLAETGQKSIDMCKNFEYPIVFMDQMMPGMDGIEAMNHIREISEYYRSGSKIVALTANALTESRQMLLDEGFDNYLKKPVEFDCLEALLIEYLKKD